MHITAKTLLQILEACSRNEDVADASIDDRIDLILAAAVLNAVVLDLHDANTLKQECDRVRAAIHSEMLETTRTQEARAQAFRDAEWRRYFAGIPPYR